MRVSQLFTKTSKNVPADETAVNAKLLIQGGFVNKEMSGVYSYLPLGFKVLQNIETIVREEMDKVGQEMLLSALALPEAWETTGRLKVVDVLMRVTPANDESMNRHNADYILNSTQEEVITPIASRHLLSYRDLPAAAYQIQTKFRNEPRAKSGLMRGREFRMKDLYSFHATETDMKAYYEQVKEAYWKVFERVGLKDSTVLAAASGGDFTDDFSHEFQTRCDAGEDTIFLVPSSGVAFNEEIAPAKAPALEGGGETPQPMQEVEGKGMIGVQGLADFLKIPVEKTTKTMLFSDENGKVIAAAVRGGYEVNTDKLRKVVGAKHLQLADEATVKRVTNAEVGYAGLLNLPADVQIVVDESCANRTNFEMGANRTDHHNINVNWGSDLPEPDQYHDIKIARKGDMYPETGEVYEVFSGSEVGNIFPLYTKFSDALGYRFVDQDGSEKPVVMGCYGIGTSRLIGVLVEKFHDDRGIIWPEAVAPMKVYLVRLGGDEAVKQAADKFYDDLQAAGITVLYDDRDISAGDKFADADLIGLPWRIVISAKTLEQGKVEVKRRSEAESSLLESAEVTTRLTA